MLNRRTLVSNAAALPALAVPALASFSPNHPDAELLRLAVQLEAVGREVAAECERGNKHSKEFDAACERAGLPNISWVDWPGGNGEDQYEKYYAYQRKRGDLAPPFDEEEDENGNTKMDRLMDRQWPIVDEIMAAQPKTLDGLRVEARALALAVPQLWDNYDSTPTELDFIGAVFTFLGLDQDGKPERHA